MFWPLRPLTSVFFFFNDPATTEIYTLSLHDALPICHGRMLDEDGFHLLGEDAVARDLDHFLEAADEGQVADRKSTRLNSSHLVISYAVFCLKKKQTRRVQITDINGYRHELTHLCDTR